MKPRDEKLLRLHDGELDPGEAEALERDLSSEEREKLLGLAELSSALQGALRSEAEEAKLDLYAGIAERLQARPAAARPGRRTFAPFAAVALAMAAAAMLLLLPKPAPTNHCVVESLEVAGAMATVLEVPDDSGDSTTVIWMDHEESDEWESL